MAYNTKKGSQHTGDIQFEGDPNETQIDFENDSITLKTGGQARLEVNNGHVSASGPVSASAFFGDGSNLTGIGGGGGSYTWTLTGDTGGGQAIDNTNTVTIAGGTGLSTTSSATDTVTVNLNSMGTPGSYTYSSITVDSQGRVSAASSGDAPAITTLNTAGATRLITSDGGTTVTANTNLTFDGNKLSIPNSGEISASMGITGSSLRTVDTLIDATHISSSLNISGAAFYANGVLLTGGGGGGISFNGSTANGLVTYGGAATADVESNLIFDGNKLSIPNSGEISASMGITGSSLRTAATLIDATHISSSLNISGAAFYANGVLLTGGGGGGSMSSWTLTGDTGASQPIEDSNTVLIAGGVGISTTGSATDTVTINLNSMGTPGSYNYASITVDNQGRVSAASSGDAPSITTLNTAGWSRLITSDGGTTATANTNLTFNGNKLSIPNSGQISASMGITGSSLRTAATVIDNTHVSSSLNISGSKFYANGVELTPGGGGISFNGSQVDGLVTYADANTADVQTALTFSPGTSKLGVAGQVSASLGVTGSSLRTATTVIDSTHISSSLNISGSKFYANGVELTPGGGGIPDVVSDTSPQLGGNLDVNGNDIVSVSNGNIELDPDGSGKVVFKGNATKGAGQFVLNCENNSHGIIIKGPPHSAAASYTLTLPNNDGDADQVLTTNGSGDLSWTTVGGGGGISFNGSTADGLVTYGGASTADVQSNITFNSINSKLTVTGQVSASLGVSGSEVHVGNAIIGNQLTFPSALSLANDTGTGEVVRFGTGTTDAGRTYFLSSSQQWHPVDTANSGTSGLPMVAVAMGSSPTADGMMIRGFFDVHTFLTGAFTPGAPLYLTGSGGVTTIRPTNPGESLRIAGHCTTAPNVIYFNPSPDYLSLV